MVSICEDADEAGKNFLKLLAGNKRLALLPEISAQFNKTESESRKVTRY